MDALSLRIISIDAALENTGYCLYSVSPATFAHQINGIGVVTTEPGPDLDSRVRDIVSQITNIASRHRANCYLIEQPPATLYCKPGTPHNVMVGRASSMFGVFAAAFGLLGYCHAYGIYHRMILPVHWQPKFPKPGMSKPWSVRQAKKVLAHLKYDYKLTGDNDHIADAINIGRQAILNYHGGKWAVPSTQ